MRVDPSQTSIPFTKSGSISSALYRIVCIVRKAIRKQFNKGSTGRKYITYLKSSTITTVNRSILHGDGNCAIACNVFAFIKKAFNYAQNHKHDSRALQKNAQ